MNIAEMLMGQLPEAVYFALFMIFTKNLKNKRFLFTIIMVFEYLLLKLYLHFSIYFQISYTVITYITLKILYKNKAQITDVFTFSIASVLLIVISAITFGIFGPNMLITSIVSRTVLFLILFVNRHNFSKIQMLYKKLWNRNDKVKRKIKSTTFRSLNIVLFNIMFYVINLSIIYALILKQE